jgi:hypothetical protein
VMSAAASNQYAGLLPGEQRPAFSYLALGAMRGWGDSNLDGTVTAQEVVDYARNALRILLSGGRAQTPEMAGDGSFPLARASEAGPDLARLLLELKSRPPSSAGSSATPAQVEGPTSATPVGAFDRQAAKRELNAAAEQARACRASDGPRGSGSVEVRYEPSGKVASVTLLTPRFEKTLTGSCVRLLFRRALVPPFIGAPWVVVTKTFEIPED